MRRLATLGVAAMMGGVAGCGSSPEEVLAPLNAAVRDCLHQGDALTKVVACLQREQVSPVTAQEKASSTPAKGSDWRYEHCVSARGKFGMVSCAWLVISVDAQGMVTHWSVDSGYSD